MCFTLVQNRLVGAQSSIESAKIAFGTSFFEYACAMVSTITGCLCVQTWGAIKRLTGRLDDRRLLRETIEKGGTAAVFLTKASGLFYTNTDALEYLVDMQSKMDTSIQLLPVAVVWQRKPSKERSDLMRFILGSEDQPGPLMKLFSAVNRDHEPIIQAGEAVELNEVLERYANQPAKRQIRVARC